MFQINSLGLRINQVQRTIRWWDVAAWRIAPTSEEECEIRAIDAGYKKRLSCGLDRFLRELRLLAPKRIAPNALDAGGLL